MNEKSFIEKVIELQASVKVAKEQFNKFGGYNYRKCEDILAEAKPIANSLGLFLYLTDEMVFISGGLERTEKESRNISEGRFYVKATARVIDGRGGCIEAYGYAREDDSKKGMDSCQVTGSTSSYARKFALSGLLGLDDEKDVDEPTPPQKTKIAQVEKKASVAAEDEDKRNEVKTTILKRLGTLGEGLQVAEKTKIMSELCGIRQWAEIEKYTLVELQGISSKLLNAIDEREKAGRRKSVKDISFKVD